MAEKKLSDAAGPIQAYWEAAVNAYLEEGPAPKAAFTKTAPVDTPPGEVPTVAPFEPDVRAVLGSGHWRAPLLTPTADNLLDGRPYFGVPLGDAAVPGQREAVTANIVEYVGKLKAGGNALSDVFLISHGWHRNLFTGASAYDRLVARFSMLLGRGVIKKPDGFVPLFLGVQWISDPGPAGWIDPLGRRHKQSFLNNVQTKFDPGPDFGTFVNHFEQMLELMARTSAPETKMIGKEDRAQATALAALLDGYTVKEAPEATLAEKIVIVWACYHESTAKAMLCDQSEKARPAASPWNALKTTLRFILGVVGIGFLLGLVGGLFKMPEVKLPPDLKAWALAQWGALSYGVTHPVEPIPEWAMWNWPVWKEPKTWWWIGGLTLLPLLILGLAVLYHHQKGKPKPGGSAIFLLVAWLPLQVIMALPVLIFLLVTYLLRTAWTFLAIAVALAGFPILGLAIFIVAFAVAIYQVAKGRPASAVFRERLLNAEDDPKYAREYLAALARFPVNWIKAAAPPDSMPVKMASGMDNQFAFFEMQRKGVSIGDEAGKFLSELLPALGEHTDLSKLRIHVIGHSFGGLVSLNAVRGLLQRINPREPSASGGVKRTEQYAMKAEQATLPVELRSLCLIQSASSSDWLRDEAGIVKAVTGGISCIYSRYDTANGFYYPAANNGRMAAGYVGLCDIGRPGVDAEVRGKGELVMIIEPPPLRVKAPAKVNVDASRAIYEGQVALGGGHDDVFKDDVVNLIWSAVRL